MRHMHKICVYMIWLRFLHNTHLLLEYTQYTTNPKYSIASNEQTDIAHNRKMLQYNGKLMVHIFGYVSI